jgi:hypothetical protein
LPNKGFWTLKHSLINTLPAGDGSYIRRIIRRDGTVELEETISVDRSMTLAARAKTGFSQAQFARLLGISVRTLHDWE